MFLRAAQRHGDEQSRGRSKHLMERRLRQETCVCCPEEDELFFLEEPSPVVRASETAAGLQHCDKSAGGLAGAVPVTTHSSISVPDRLSSTFGGSSGVRSRRGTSKGLRWLPKAVRTVDFLAPGQHHALIKLCGRNTTMSRSDTPAVKAPGSENTRHPTIPM